MVEIGIPVYHAKKTLPDLLDALVAQTKKMFIVCLSIDGDGEDYSNIISTYRARGLKIRVINGKNGGPGPARQRIIDTTQCDYIMFADADDLLYPRAVEVLYTEAKKNNLDILRAGFYQEYKHQGVSTLGNKGPITWMHGKIYKVDYLKKNNIRLLDELPTEEDAYFNVVAWNSTSNRGTLDEVVYLWRDNPESLTRKMGLTEFFKKDYVKYIQSQIWGMNKIFEIKNEIENILVTQTVLNIYYYYMTARFYKLDEKPMDKALSEWRKEKWFQMYLNDATNWIDIVNNLRPGKVIDDHIIFYSETINDWIKRLLKA